MSRYGLIVLAVFLMGSAAARPKKPPKLEVRLSITKRKAALLDRVPMTITVKNRGDSTVELPPLRIADDAVTIVLTDGDKAFRLRRIFGDFSTGSHVPESVTKAKLKRSRKITEKLEMIAIRPGTYQVTAEVRGVEGMKEPAVSRPIELTVSPHPEGKQLRARIRTTVGTMTAELYPDDAYNMCHEFVVNARDGFYDGQVFFRILKGFMAQTGCPKNDGTGRAGHHVPAEFNARKHEKGVLSTARASHPDSGGSQFFIMHGTRPSLDGKYTVFGRVIETIENLRVLDEIMSVRVGPNARGEMSAPKDRIELKGVEIDVR